MNDTITIKDYLLSDRGKKLVSYFSEKLKIHEKKTCGKFAWPYVLLVKAWNILACEWELDNRFAEFKLHKSILEARVGDIYRKIYGWAMYGDNPFNIFSTNEDDAYYEKLALLESWLVNPPWQVRPDVLQLPK